MNTTKAAADIAVDMYPFLCKYKDGRIKRFPSSSFVPASEVPAVATGVASRDVVIDAATGVSTRLFLSAGALATPKNKAALPLIVYFHGGAFCTGSAFSKMSHRYAESLAARAGALVVSVDYRLTPEHPIPAAYDDAQTALRWAASLSDPWLASHGDPGRVFLAGESAGANIVHNVASRAGSVDIDIEGLILLHPFFWGSQRLPFETDRRHDGHALAPERLDVYWPFLTAGTANNDDPCLNPPAEQVAALPCRRAFVAVASKDVFRDRGRRYAAWLDQDRGRREVTFVESEGEDHTFHLFRPARATAVELMDRVVEFVNKSTSSTATNRAMDEMLASGPGKKICVSPRSMARVNALLVVPEQASAPRFGLMMGHSRLVLACNKMVRKGPFGPAGLGRTVAHAYL